MRNIAKMFSSYVVAFILITCVCGLVYVVAYQIIREGANDPQVQIARDSVPVLASGEVPTFGPEKMDLRTSLATFLAVYDKDGNPIESNAMLDGSLPKPDKAIFDVAKEKGEYRVTWQPVPEVLQALVVVPANNEAGQFIAVGRSLAEVQRRTNMIFIITAIAWGIMLLVSFLGILAKEEIKKDEVIPPTT